MKRQIVGGLLCLSAGIGLTACVDDSYDLSKDIDMTVQIGTEGLQVKLGNTERIMLANILEIDDEEMIEETEEGMYYLIKDGNTKFSFDVPTIKTRIDIASLVPETEIFNYDKYVNDLGGNIPDNMEIPAGKVFGTDEAIGTKDFFQFKQNDVPTEVVSIKKIIPSYATKKFKISLGINTNDNQRLAFVLDEISDFQIQLPYFIKCVNPSAGITIEGDKLIVNNLKNINEMSVNLGTFELDCIETEGELGQKVEEANNERILEIKDDIAFQGNFTIKTNNAFKVQKGDYAKVEFNMTLDGTQENDMVDIVIDKVTGIFNPVIDPSVDPIDISEDLPDFLNDEEVRMDVSNPTIRFDIAMEDIPTDINFYSEMSGYKNNQVVNTVRLPETGIGVLQHNLYNTLYFYQGASPFDPEGVVDNSQLFEVTNLSTLVEKIPDEIRVDLSEGHIQLKQDELQTIELSKDYAASANYTVYVPFQFNKGLKIVYKDSTDSFEDDLQDFEAKGAIVTANVFSTIPLDLIATGYAVDINGNVIESIQFSKANIAAAGNDGKEVESNIQLDLDLTEPSALKAVDRIFFRIEAGAGQDNGTLNNKQYLDVKDIRLKLKGAIIADLN